MCLKMWCRRTFSTNFRITGCIPSSSHQKCGVHMSSIYRPVMKAPVNKHEKSNKKAPSKGQSEPLSKSQKLFIENGLMRYSSCNGAPHLLPMALRSMEKLIKLIDNYMSRIQNCQKLQMPILTSSSLWKATGRFDVAGAELLRVEDRHSKTLLLSPTHEEAICDLLRSSPLSYNQLPLRLYQITEKFRDEKRPRFGLLRGRQFLMKDLYTFDESMEAAEKTYDEVNEVYEKLLNSLGVKWIKAIGSTGIIGGSRTNEFHLISEVGEDSVIECKSCGNSFNAELLEDEEEIKAAASSGVSSAIVSTNATKCIQCGSTSNLSSATSIEVAHSFLLGTKYTKPLETCFVNSENERLPLEMGCYGLGVSRLLAASVEVNSTESEIRWPVRISPYLVSIIPPKAGSKEESLGAPIAQKLYNSLQKIIPGDVIYDDRTNKTIGMRLMDTKELGIPYIIVCGKNVKNPSGPLLEFHDLSKASTLLRDVDKIFTLLYDIKSEINKLT